MHCAYVHVECHEGEVFSCGGPKHPQISAIQDVALSAHASTCPAVPEGPLQKFSCLSEALLKHHPRPNTRCAEAPMIVQFLDPSCPFSPLVFKPITWRYMCAHCTRTPATRPAWIERHMRIVGCVAAFFGSHQSQRSWPGACVEHSGSCKNSVCCALTENTRPPLNPPAGKVGAQPLNR